MKKAEMKVKEIARTKNDEFRFLAAVFFEILVLLIFLGI